MYSFYRRSIKLHETIGGYLSRANIKYALNVETRIELGVKLLHNGSLERRCSFNWPLTITSNQKKRYIVFMVTV